jgi:hypothetical protein
MAETMTDVERRLYFTRSQIRIVLRHSRELGRLADMARDRGFTAAADRYEDGALESFNCAMQMLVTDPDVNMTIVCVGHPIRVVAEFDLDSAAALLPDLLVEGGWALTFSLHS